MARCVTGVAVAIGVLVGSACGNPTGPFGELPPDDYELPAPDTSLNPDRLTVGDYIATPCDLGQWGNGLAHLRDRHEWALVDVFFGRASAEGPWDGPVASDIALVESYAGRVLHGFHVPAVRARMVLSRIPDLVADGYWITVRDVPDATRYDIPLSVGFTRPVTDDDVNDFASLGGRVTHEFQFINGLAGILPDRSVAVLQNRPDVAYVQVAGVACLAAPERP